MTVTAPDAVMCDNEDHDEPVPAIVRITWPDGRFNSTLACHDCMLMMIEYYVIGDEDGARRPALITDIADHTVRADLGRVQVRAWANKQAQGFNTTDVPLDIAYLLKELAEVFDAWCRNEPVGPELADVVIFAAGLAQMLGVDLARAVIGKLARQ